jgi:hypothetical protein
LTRPGCFFTGAAADQTNGILQILAGTSQPFATQLSVHELQALPKVPAVFGTAQQQTPLPLHGFPPALLQVPLPEQLLIQ